MVYVFFATGFEEIEAISVVDILRRAEIETKMVGVSSEGKITGAHNITVNVDSYIDDVYGIENAEMLVLPGGIPGINNLKASATLENIVKEAHKKGTYIAAICAAPTVLKDWGLLEGEKATVYPSLSYRLGESFLKDQAVVKSGNVITGTGVGTALEFSLKLVEALRGTECTDKIQKQILFSK